MRRINTGGEIAVPHQTAAVKAVPKTIAFYYNMLTAVEQCYCRLTSGVPALIRPSPVFC